MHMVLHTSVLRTDRVNMRRINPYFWTLVTPRRVPWDLAYFPKRRLKFRFLEL